MTLDLLLKELQFKTKPDSWSRNDWLKIDICQMSHWGLELFRSHKITKTHKISHPPLPFIPFPPSPTLRSPCFSPYFYLCLPWPLITMPALFIRLFSLGKWNHFWFVCWINRFCWRSRCRRVSKLMMSFFQSFEIRRFVLNCLNCLDSLDHGIILISSLNPFDYSNHFILFINLKMYAFYIWINLTLN